MQSAMTPRQKAIRVLFRGALRDGILAEYTAPDGPLYTTQPIGGNPGGALVLSRNSLDVRYYDEQPKHDPHNFDGMTVVTVPTEKFEAVPVSIYGRTWFRYE